MAQTGALTPAQRHAITAIMTTRTVTAAAEKAGVPLRTLTRWLTRDDFQAALHAAEADLVAGTVRMLLAASGQAVATTTTVLTDKATADGVKLRAADLILTHGGRWYEVRSLEERLTALEEEVLRHGD